MARLVNTLQESSNRDCDLGPSLFRNSHQGREANHRYPDLARSREPLDTEAGQFQMPTLNWGAHAPPNYDEYAAARKEEIAALVFGAPFESSMRAQQLGSRAQQYA